MRMVHAAEGLLGGIGLHLRKQFGTVGIGICQINTQFSAFEARVRMESFVR
jgi:hypothetical protein